jgi:DNA-binding NtrC family response regulator
VTVLLAGVQDSIATGLVDALARRQCHAVACGRTGALASISEHSPAAVLVGLSDTGTADGVELLRRIRGAFPQLCLLAIPASSSEELVLAAFRAGATDYLSTSGAADELARQVLKHCSPARNLHGGEAMIGYSDEMSEIRGYIEKVAASDSNVLITGETGTGKELAAGMIHRNSSRASRPLVCVNCAAIPDTLLESELFGFERGAFTGAHLSTPGKIEMANGGTVFFDEIGELSPYAQARLLRVMEEKQIQRLGGRKPVAVNVRFMAATNRDLDTMAMANEFRRDLYFRLNVGRIHLPPLRERKPDIPVLIDHYMAELNRQFGSDVNSVEPEVVEHLLGYSWPGNIRELKNLLEGVFVSRPSSKITFFDLPEWFRKRHPIAQAPQANESDQLLSALHATNWNKSAAAGKLNWSRMTLYRKMAKYGLQGKL